MKLGKDVFVALAAIAWADGAVDETEANALLGGARASGLAGADLEAVRGALLFKTEVTSLAGLPLSQDEREFVYAIAAWLTRVDGVVTDAEGEALAKLGGLLGLGEEDRARGLAASAALGGFEGAGGGRDVMALAREIERGAAEG